ncbi:MAG TPA: MFS transporter [Victivallales bacterium]|nr:MFS transporter [Victivallales bacterium]
MYFSFFNGICSACISTNIMSLFLLQLNFRPFIVVISTSFVNFGMIAVLCAKYFIAKKGAAYTMGLSWLFKGGAAVLIVTTPFFLPQYLLEMSMLCFIFVFCIFRSLGNPALEPLLIDLTEPTNRGRYTSHSFLNYNTSMLISFIVLYLLLRFVLNIYTYRIIIFIGAVANIICCFILFRVKETDFSKTSALNYTILKALTVLFRDKKVRKFMLLSAVVLSLNSLVITVSIIALDKVYGVVSSVALIFIIIQVLGGIIASYFSRFVSEHTGPQPLIIIYFIGTALTAAFWVFIPDHNIPYFNLIMIFILGGATSTGLTTSTFHQFLMIVPQEKSVGYSLFYSVFCGAFGGVVTLMGSAVLWFLRSNISESIQLYSYFYLILLVVLIIVLLLIFIFKNKGGWSLSKVMNILLSPKELSTMNAINKMEKYSSPENEMHDVKEICMHPSQISEEALLYYAKSPSTLIRLMSIRGLQNTTVTEKSNAVLMKELRRGEFTTAYLAAYSLGVEQYREAIPLLRTSMNSKDYQLKAFSIAALGKMGDKESIVNVEKILIESEIPIVIIFCCEFLLKLKSDNLVLLLFDKILNLKCKTIFLQELLYFIAKYYNSGDLYYRYIRLCQLNVNEAKELIISEYKKKAFPWKFFEDTIDGKVHLQIVINYFYRRFMKFKKEEFVYCLLKLKDSNALTKRQKIEILALMFIAMINDD